MPLIEVVDLSYLVARAPLIVFFILRKSDFGRRVTGTKVMKRMKKEKEEQN